MTWVCIIGRHSVLIYIKYVIVIFLENILRGAGLLLQGNLRFPFFLYNEYSINSIENIMILHTMKYIYECEFDDSKPKMSY